LTLRQAAIELGMGNGRQPAQRLRRQLRARELSLGYEFVLRGPTARSPWLVTLPLLRENCPELFSPRDELAKMLRAEIDRIDDALAELRARDQVIARDVAGRVKALRQRVDRMAAG
jgi:hypothetical protein